MVRSNKVIPAVLATAAVAMAQFNAPVDPLSHAYTVDVQQNRTISSDQNYNALNRAGMPIGLVDIHRHLVNMEMGINGQKVAGDSMYIKNIAVKMPRFTVGAPGKIAFSAQYGIVPMTTNFYDDSLTLTMPQHRFGFILAAQEPKSGFRIGANLDAFIGKSRYKETADSGRAILGADNLGLSLGMNPNDMVTIDLGLYASGYIDTLFGTVKNESGENSGKMIRQERMAEVEFPRISSYIQIGDTTLPVVTAFDFTYGKKHFVYANRAANSANSGNVIGMNTGADSYWPNQDAIVTDSIRWNLAGRGNIVPVESKFEINPSLEFGYLHNRTKRMKPGEKNHPMTYDGEREGFKWETSSFRFGLGLDMLFIDCIDYWNEYGFSNMKLELVGSEIKEEGENRTEKFHRYATGAELAFHDIAAMNFPESGKLWFNLGFQMLQESGMFGNFYGSTYSTKQYVHFNDISTGTQSWRYYPWENIKHRIKTNDFTIGVRGSFNHDLIELGSRIHFLNQSYEGWEFAGEPVEIDPIKGPKYQFDFTYNLTDKNRKK